MLYCSKTNIRDETGLYFADHKKTHHTLLWLEQYDSKLDIKFLHINMSEYYQYTLNPGS